MHAMNATGAHPAISVRNVFKTFDAELAPVRALRGADLTVMSGDFVAVMGPSGCGKSTLLNVIGGLDVPDEGEIEIAGEPVTGKTSDELARMRRRHVGIVFQFFNLLDGMTVTENVAMPAMIAGTKRKPAEARAKDLLDLLGLGDKAQGCSHDPVGWPASTARDRAGAGQPTDGVAGGRTDRVARLGGRPGDPRALRTAPPRLRADDRRDHPRSARGRCSATGRQDARRSHLRRRARGDAWAEVRRRDGGRDRSRCCRVLVRSGRRDRLEAARAARRADRVDRRPARRGVARRRGRRPDRARCPPCRRLPPPAGTARRSTRAAVDRPDRGHGLRARCRRRRGAPVR